MSADPRCARLFGAALLLLFSSQPRSEQAALGSGLLDATGKGDIAAVTELIARGADVNFADDQGLTPLFIAADRANAALVKLLLDHGADPNRTQELMWGRTALSVASVSTSEVQDDRARDEIIRLLIDRGAGSTGEALADLVRGGHLDAVQTILGRGNVKPSYLNAALAMAKRAGKAAAVELLTKAGATEPSPLDLPRSPERIKRLTGIYRAASGQQFALTLGMYDDYLLLERAGRPSTMLFPVELTLLKSEDRAIVIAMMAGALPPPEVTFREDGRVTVFRRIGDVPTRTSSGATNTRSTSAPNSAPPSPAVVRTKEWPSFRGAAAAGTAEGAHPPTTWDLEKSLNIKWKIPIPGFAHSSPIVWGERIFVTTAVPESEATLTFKNDPAAVASTTDSVRHSWRVYALDRRTGKILWERVAHEGVPRTQRHVMASQANSTPATDGTHVVAFFGSEGLYCYDVEGKLLWQRDLGPLRANRILDASYEWNTASSPIIYKNHVILQLDLMESSHISAFDIATGNEVWRTERDEIPSWSTPLVYDGPPRTTIVTAAGKFARGYDPVTGKELWKLGKHSEFPTPSPIAGSGLIFITSGTGSTVQPIYAIRPDAVGDITLKDNEESNTYVAWSKVRGGPTIPTPIVYGGLLYVCSTTGILAAYDARTGERLYQERLTRGGGYSSSAVAADGKLYFANEEGEVIVVKAGEKFEKLAVNKMGELIMATPALSDDMLILKTRYHLVAASESAAAKP